MVDTLKPRSHAERIALFRAQVIGPLVAQQLFRGELKAGLRRLSKQPFMPPGASRSRTYGVSTLENWYYRLKRGGLQALSPKQRSDAGHGRALTEEQRDLLCAIRQEYPSASAELIVRTLQADGRLEAGQVSASTVRRLFRERGLPRRPRDLQSRQRRRWQVERPGHLWHADVCHGQTLRVGERAIPVRIHAILDDASRYIVALMVSSNEREAEMLELLARAVRRFGAPNMLYLDNGATYTGETLRIACARLDIALVHARPYDPEARGKMERFWRTMREGCLDHLGCVASLHDIQVRLFAWLDTHYHRAPHAGLMGQAPGQRWITRQLTAINEEKLAAALMTTGRRRVRKDGTISVGGMDWEIELGHLAGRLVRIERCLLEPNRPPVLVIEDRRIELQPVEPVVNSTRKRRSFTPKPGLDQIAFDPNAVHLDRYFGRL